MKLGGVLVHPYNIDLDSEDPFWMLLDHVLMISRQEKVQPVGSLDLFDLQTVVGPEQRAVRWELSLLPKPCRGSHWFSLYGAPGWRSPVCVRGDCPARNPRWTALWQREWEAQLAAGSIPPYLAEKTA